MYAVFYTPYFAKFLFSEVMSRLFLCRNLLPSLSLLAFFNANLQDLMQDAAFSFANIAQRLHKSDSTISREIIRNRYQFKTSANHTVLCGLRAIIVSHTKQFAKPEAANKSKAKHLELAHFCPSQSGLARRRNCKTYNTSPPPLQKIFFCTRQTSRCRIFRRRFCRGCL